MSIFLGFIVILSVKASFLGTVIQVELQIPPIQSRRWKEGLREVPGLNVVFCQWIRILSFSRVDLKFHNCTHSSQPHPLDVLHFSLFSSSLLYGRSHSNGIFLSLQLWYGHAFLLSNLLYNFLITELSLLPRMYCNTCLSLHSPKVFVALDYLIM